MLTIPHDKFMQAFKVITKVCGLGANAAFWERMYTNEAILREFITRICELEPEVETITVPIDYSLSLLQMYELADFSQEAFRCREDVPFDKIPFTKRIKKGSGDITLSLVRYAIELKTEEVLNELRKIKLQPADAAEMFALFAKHRHYQPKQGGLIVLGSIWKDTSRDRGRVMLAPNGEYLSTRSVRESWEPEKSTFLCAPLK